MTELKPCRKCLEYTSVEDMNFGVCYRCIFKMSETIPKNLIDRARVEIKRLGSEISKIRNRLSDFLKQKSVPPETVKDYQTELAKRQIILHNIQTRLNQRLSAHPKINGVDFKAVRREKGLTQQQAAVELGISTSTIKRVEDTKLYLNPKETSLYTQLLLFPSNEA